MSLSVQNHFKHWSLFFPQIRYFVHTYLCLSIPGLNFMCMYTVKLLWKCLVKKQVTTMKKSVTYKAAK